MEIALDQVCGLIDSRDLFYKQFESWMHSVLLQTKQESAMQTI